MTTPYSAAEKRNIVGQKKATAQAEKDRAQKVNDKNRQTEADEILRQANLDN